MKKFQNMIRYYYSPTAASTAILFISAIYFRWKILKLLKSKDTWAMAGVLFCFSMVSGYTWNKMMRPAFYFTTNQGPVYISSTTKKQFVTESYVVASMNGAVVLGMILAIEGAGGVSETVSIRKRRLLLIWAGLALMLSSFALLSATYGVKNRFYPYGLLWVLSNIRHYVLL